LKSSAVQLLERKDFLTFQLEELDQLSIDSWDEEALNNEHNLIANQKELNSYLKQISSIYISENGISNLLLKFNDLFEKVNLHLKDLNPFIERLNSARIDIEDIYQEINTKYTFQNSSPERLNELNDLLKQINFSLKKFNVVDVTELIKKRDKISHSISQLKDIDQEINECENKKIYWQKECLSIGNLLMKARLENFNYIEEKVNSVLKSISMDHADFKLRIQKSNNISSLGIDSLELLISVNNKNEYFPINKFSSGGELSRIALAMKSISSSSKFIPIMIFDEIDTGISGKVASEVGLLLKEISKKIQVINITHLPQVAAFAKAHYHVEKKDNGYGMESKLTVLQREDRIQVLAKMLGGDKTGKAARNNALELLN
jgi:DNA repair protein RecN (Recombination protein N)